MKNITILLLKWNIKIAKKKQTKVKTSIVKGAYDNLIKSYNDTIMFLKADSCDINLK